MISLISFQVIIMKTKPASHFTPYISTEKTIKEFSLRAIGVGVCFGLFFAIANAYLALKIGMTVSASIPSAILSMAVFKMFSKRATILEHNMVQTISSVGEAIAAGVVFTIPALIFLDASPSIFRIFFLSFLGGILGIFFMIPMRRYIIVKEHGILPFPEGTACADILKAGEEKKSSAILALWGVIAGAVYKICSSIFNLWPEVFRFNIKAFHNAQVALEGTPALLGVGYIIGPRICSLLFCGGIISWWVIIPLIQIFGENTTIYPATVAIGKLAPEQIWSYYIRYIGAGAVAIGGLFGLVKVYPLLVKSIHVGVKELFSGFKTPDNVKRVEKDISLGYLVLGTILIILLLWLFPGMPMNFLTIILLCFLGYFFTAVTSLTVGIVGSSSNPISGMTITTLLVTCIIFALLGWTDRIYLIAAITMSSVANVAICLASTTSQDLKTGYLLGATPKYQQIAEIIGIVLPSIFLGIVLYLLNQAFHIGSEQMPAPQASLMAMIANGVISGELPYDLVIIGVIIGLFLQILKIPVLPFALGLYLPLSISTAIMIGGLVSAYVHRHVLKEKINEKARLICAGLIGGDACLGVIVALLATLGIISAEPKGILPPFVTPIAYVLLACGIAYLAKKEQVEK